MKILFFGDSITDASRLRGSADAGRVAEKTVNHPQAYGTGFVFLTAAQLLSENANSYQIINRGIGGDRLPQLYARIQLDVWNEQPDVLSILVGTNDLDTGDNPNCTELKRWGRVYRMLLSDTKEKCPNTKIMLCEPFTLQKEERPVMLRYASEAEKIAEEFGLPFVKLQEKLDRAVERYGIQACFYDGIHPDVIGSKVICDAWLETFRAEILRK